MLLVKHFLIGPYCNLHCMKTRKCFFCCQLLFCESLLSLFAVHTSSYLLESTECCMHMTGAKVFRYNSVCLESFHLFFKSVFPSNNSLMWLMVISFMEKFCLQKECFRAAALCIECCKRYYLSLNIIYKLTVIIIISDF